MWKTVKLGDVCTIKTGKKDVNEGNSEGTYPFFTCAKEHTYSDVFSFDCEAILIAGNGAVGQTTYFKGKFEAYQRTYVLTDFQSILPKLLLFILQGRLMQHLSSMVLGNTIPYIKKGMLNDFEFFLPPLAEQQRIVAKLDAAFAEIDKAIELSERSMNDALLVYSHTIDELFERYGDERVSLGRLSNINYGYTAKASHDKGTYKFLRITDIQNNGVDWEKVPYCEVEQKKLANALLYDGDIVFARTGATTGKSFLVEKPKDAVFASYLIRVSVDREKLIPRYVLHYFQSASYWKQVEEGISGAAQGGFNASKLSDLQIPVVSQNTQQTLIEQLDNVLIYSNRLTTIQEQKKNYLLRLKSSLLTQELNPSEAA